MASLSAKLRKWLGTTQPFDVELHANEAHPDLDLQPEQIEALVQSSA